MARHILLVLSNATDGGDDEFNDWYTNVHLSDVLKVEGFVAAQRFRLSETQLAGGEPPYRYAAIYEVETDDLQRSADALGAAGSGDSAMVISPKLDRSRTVAWFFDPATDMVRAGA
jgi:hypothetical protein